MRPLLATLLACALSTPARADDEVRWNASLHTWWTRQEGRPSTALPYDVSARAFDPRGYLEPQGAERWASVDATAGAEGRYDRFSWGFRLDTGELRSERFPRLAGVCFAPLTASPSGLDAVGSGHCTVKVDGARPVLAAEEARLAGAQLTANGRPFEDELSKTLLVREAWAGATFGRNDFALLRLGRRRFTVGDGFVYDDWGLGVDLDLDLGALGPSWELALAALSPSRDWADASGAALVAVRADFLPSLFEHAGVFAAWFHDRADAVVELFRASLLEPGALALRGLAPGQSGYASENRLLLLQLNRNLDGAADLGWAGTSGSLRVGGPRLDWTAALAFGTFTFPELRLGGSPLTVTQSDRSYGLLGELVHVRLRAALDAFALGGFLVFESGDEPPPLRTRRQASRSYSGFLGVSPYVTDLDLFFQGGVADTFSSRQASAPGVNGRGVIAPGVSLSWLPDAAASVDLRGAYLLAPVDGPFGGRVYGQELDLEVVVAPLAWLKLVGEADVLFPGDFFPRRAPYTRVVLGTELVAFP